MGQDDREIVVWHHRLNHYSFKYLLRISKRGIIPRKLINIRKIPPRVACLFVKSHKRSWRNEEKHSGGSIRKTSDTRRGAMISIYHMISSQPGLTPK